ncbi:MAG: porin [Burkholderiales bacterium]
MNKKLMAVAVAGAIGAPGLAFAQAANVSIYGVIDGRVDSMKFSASSVLTAGVPTNAGLTKSHVQFQAPRWGLRGSEDLGGGLTAYFQMESGMTPDGRADPVGATGGVNTLGGRDSFFGIRSTSWGSIQAGGFGTAFKGIQNVWNANPSINHGGIIMGNGDSTGATPSPNCQTPVSFATTALLAVATPACATQAEGGALAFSRRESNYIEYTTPNFSGFQGKLGTVASEYAEPSNITPAGTSNSKPKLWSFNGTWSGGPWSAGMGYETHQGYRATNTAATNRMAKDKAWTIGGKWNFGQGQIGAGWESMDYGNAGTAAASNAFKQKFWVINGSYNLTATGTLSAGYSKTPGRKSCGAGLTDAAGTCGTATGSKHLTLGYDHALSKRTALYAQYMKLDNNGNTVGGAAYYYIAGPTGNGGSGVASGGGAIAGGTDVTSYTVGVKHSF